MANKQQSDMRDQFESAQLDKLIEQLEWRDWTHALLQQRIAELDERLAAGDMPILETVSAEISSPPPSDSSPEDFAAFLEG